MFCSDVKSLSCPAAVCAGVGTIWEVSKLGGLNIKECLQPRKYAPRKIVFAGGSGEADPHPCWGRPMTWRKKQVHALCGTRRGKGPDIRARIRRDNVGKIPLAAGAVATC